MLVKTQGIVLKEIKFEDTSKILTIFSRKNGKIYAIARGALRPRSHIIACSQVFSYSDFTLFKGRKFYYVNQGDIISSFYSLRENINRLFYGAYMLELIECCIVEEQPNERLFKLLIKGLIVLSKLNKNFMKFIVCFELKYISFIGYRPVLNKCVSCNHDIVKDAKFSFKYGGVLCNECFNIDSSSQNIRFDNIKILKILLYTPLDKINNVKVSENVMFKLHQMLVKYILTNIEKDYFKSLNFLKLI